MPFLFFSFSCSAVEDCIYKDPFTEYSHYKITVCSRPVQTAVFYNGCGTPALAALTIARWMSPTQWVLPAPPLHFTWRNSRGIVTCETDERGRGRASGGEVSIWASKASLALPSSFDWTYKQKQGERERERERERESLQCNVLHFQMEMGLASHGEYGSRSGDCPRARVAQVCHHIRRRLMK